MKKIKNPLEIKIENQPTNTTCGPTSLHAVYQFYKDPISLDQIIDEIKQFDAGGGTLGGVLGRHALKRGYQVELYSYNINIFDPTWFNLSGGEIIKALTQRLKKQNIDEKQTIAITEYISFLKEGGELKFQDLSSDLILKYLNQGIPILVGLSATWLYQSAREDSQTNEFDPIEGDPVGHFVVIYGHKKDTMMIADPYRQNPLSDTNFYKVTLNRLMNAIILGVSTYDGNFLIIKGKK